MSESHDRPRGNRNDRNGEWKPRQKRSGNSQYRGGPRSSASGDNPRDNRSGHGSFGQSRDDRANFRRSRDTGEGFRRREGDARDDRGGFRRERDQRNTSRRDHGARGPRDDERRPSEGRGGFRGSRDERSGRNDRSHFQSNRDDRGGFRGGRDGDDTRRSSESNSESNRSRGGYRGKRDDRDARGGRGGFNRSRPSGEREGSQSNRDRWADREERSGYRSERGGDQRARRSYAGKRNEQSGRDSFRGRRDERSPRSGARRDRNESQYRDGARDRRNTQSPRDGYRGKRDVRNRHDARPGRDEQSDRREFLDSPEAFDRDREERVREGREPYVPAEITGSELSVDLRRELKALSKEQMERVSRHLVACALAQEEGDQSRALEHAKWAARFGARVAAVREVYGALLYDAAEYKTALRELRAAMRISGRVDLLPMVADSERGLGRPEKALDVAQLPEARKLSDSETIELMIVVAGAYADMGDLHTAIATLEVPALRHKVEGQWQFRLWLAYADLLEADGQSDEARKWVTLAADADVAEETDAAERLGRPPRPVEIPTLETSEQIGVIDVYAEYMAEEAEVERSRDRDLAAEAEAIEKESEVETESELDAEIEADYEDALARSDHDEATPEADGVTAVDEDELSDSVQAVDAIEDEDDSDPDGEQWAEPDAVLDDNTGEPFHGDNFDALESGSVDEDSIGEEVDIEAVEGQDDASR